MSKLKSSTLVSGGGAPESLVSHLTKHNIPLTKSNETLPDGNCWYSSVCDQINILRIPGAPRTPGLLRAAVSRSFPQVAEAKGWTVDHLGGPQGLVEFVARHRKTGEWTDEKGLICQATAIYLKRNINIVDIRDPRRPGLTSLPGGGFSNVFPPLNIGYSGNHFQSLKVDYGTNSRPAVSFHSMTSASINHEVNRPTLDNDDFSTDFQTLKTLIKSEAEVVEEIYFKDDGTRLYATKNDKNKEAKYSRETNISMESVNVSRSDGTFSSRLNISMESSIISHELDSVVSSLPAPKFREFLPDIDRRICGYSKSRDSFMPQFLDLSQDLDVSTSFTTDDVWDERESKETKRINDPRFIQETSSVGQLREYDQVYDKVLDKNEIIEVLEQLSDIEDDVVRENEDEDSEMNTSNEDSDDRSRLLNHLNIKICIVIRDPKNIIRNLKLGKSSMPKTTHSLLTKKMLDHDKSPVVVKHGKKRRCLGCEICSRPDCRACKNCIDMVKYGGNGSRRQKCVKRKCF